MMGSMDPKLDGVRYFEWIGMIFALIWIIQTGFHYRKNSKSKFHREIVKIPFLNRYRQKDQENPS